MKVNTEEGFAKGPTDTKLSILWHNYKPWQRKSFLVKRISSPYGKLPTDPTPD